VCLYMYAYVHVCVCVHMCTCVCVCVCGCGCMQIENVHGLIAAATSRSSPGHLDHVFELIKKVRRG